MGRIIQTMLEVVPEELRPEIMRRLRDDGPPPLDVEEVAGADDDEDAPYDPDDEDDYGDGI
jgi:hypothetical protein